MEMDYFTGNKDFIIGQILDNKKQLYRMGVEHLCFCGFEEENGRQKPVLIMKAREESKVDLIDFFDIEEKIKEILQTECLLCSLYSERAKLYKHSCIEIF